jgi:superfamily I DNA/RNA helicase
MAFKPSSIIKETSSVITPTTEQQLIVSTSQDKVNLAVEAYAGAAKCLGKGTLITMFDSSLKKVENIKVGDKVLGIDGTPRNVLSISSGKEEMFKINQTKGITFTCNKSHILSVYMSIRQGVKYNYKNTKLIQGDIVNLSVSDYLDQSVTFKKDAKCYTPEKMSFSERSIPVFDPYFVGLWLGDGNNNSCIITKPDQEIINYLHKFCEENDLEFYLREQKGKCVQICVGNDGNTGTENKGNTLLRNLGIFSNKHIPDMYKFASLKDRRELIAGLIDSDGSLTKNYYTWSNKNKRLFDDFVFVCRTLGFKVTIEKMSVAKYPNNDYWRANIFGEGLEELPIKIPRKKAKPRQQIKNANVTGFSVESIGIGEYFGFTLDGDSLFLLEDFTVTHNTTTCKLIAKANLEPSLYIAFNSSIAKEAAETFPSHVECRTMHSIAYEHIVRGTGFAKRGKLIGYYDYKEIAVILKNYMSGMEEHQQFDFMSDCVSMFKAYCQSDNFHISEVVMSFFEDEEEPSDHRHYIGAVTKIWEELSNPKSQFKSTHDVYLKLFQLSKPILSKYKTFYLDEYQDTNAVTLDIFLRQQGQLIAVGDRYQSIYAWRGAVNAFDYLPKSFVNLNLTESFRFGPNVAEQANKLLEYMDAKLPLKGKGTKKEVKSEAILVRNNSTLFEILLDCAEKGKKAYVIADLNDMFSAMYTANTLRFTPEGKQPEFGPWPHKQIASYGSWAAILKDKSPEIKKIVKLINICRPSVHQAIQKIKSILVDEEHQNEADVIVCTGHKSKGLEWDRVTVSEDFAPFVLEEGETFKETLKRFKEAQGMELLYVAITRSRVETILSPAIKQFFEDMEWEKEYADDLGY